MTNSKHPAQTSRQASPFKQFPEFTRLLLHHRKDYEELIADYPPLADLSFDNLLLWWDIFGESSISTLNGNVVISYWVPGSNEMSGISLVGRNNVDESICTIFDYLKENGHDPRLVNVPTFVLENSQHPELFKFSPDPANDEYVFPLEKFSKLEKVSKFRRNRIQNFMRWAGSREIVVKSLDLSLEVNVQKMLDAQDNWPKKGVNSFGKVGEKVLERTLTHYSELGCENVCLFAGDELVAYSTYKVAADPRYWIADFARVNYEIPRIFDYMLYAFTNYAVKRGAQYMNMRPDYGSARMRVVKIALGPSNFFKKYTVEPAK